jgi:aspartate racemase
MGKTVGILGGMGPAATVDLFDAIVRGTPARTDQEHLHILVNNDPAIPDRTAAILHGGPDPRPRLIAAAQLLERMGAELIAMPCNTAHYYWADLQTALAIPVLNMIHETARAVARLPQRAQQVGILATSATLRTGLYQEALRAAGLRPLEPDERELSQAMAAIYSIKAGEDRQQAKALLAEAGHGLIGRGAQALILGCTEIPLVLHDGDLPAPLVSSTQALAAAVVAAAWAPELAGQGDRVVARQG